MSYHRPHTPPPKGDSGLCPQTRGLAPLSGMVAGTDVLTRAGFRKVDELGPGADVITRDRGLCPVTAVTHVSGRSRMVHFSKSALGDAAPQAGITLPAHHLVLVRDWRAEAMFGKHEARVQAAALIDDAYITDAGMQEVTCLQLWLRHPAILYARGLELFSAHEFDSQLRPQV
ncbi:Hint domain-containing protein [Tritonibacter horizontis]|uniref:Hedgehog/Intein (Hint) domain-containing protein n=1 Tax=Tritonibacter horizontis TaxID=1768241 RepID=A0A132BTP1_9RHOB|nr:Hint domain-containing protein [Tritonibacter horizontis]KUP91749.1 hypothetical protein TRIHO_34110 [Tritonibacter horizontis]